MLTNKEIRRQASRFLLAERSLSRMSLGICVCIAALIMPIIFFACLMYFASFEGMNENIGAIFTIVALLGSLAMSVFFTIPMLGGFLKVSYEIYRGSNTAHIADIFSVFASPRIYIRTIIAGLMAFWRAVIILMPLIFSFSFIVGLWEKNNSPFAFLICLTFTVFAIFAGAGVAFFIGYLTQAQYFVPYYLCMGNSLPGAVTLSKTAVSKRRSEIWGYLIGLLPIFILSLLTVGVLFIVYSAPMMIFAYFIHCEKMTMIER